MGSVAVTGIPCNSAPQSLTPAGVRGRSFARTSVPAARLPASNSDLRDDWVRETGRRPSDSDTVECQCWSETEVLSYILLGAHCLLRAEVRCHAGAAHDI